jgi:hypothetical protein
VAAHWWTTTPTTRSCWCVSRLVVWLLVVD